SPRRGRRGSIPPSRYAPTERRARLTARLLHLQRYRCQTPTSLFGSRSSEDPVAQLLERLRPELPIHQHPVAKEQRRRHLVPRLRERQARLRQRNPRDRHLEIAQLVADVAFAAAGIGSSENLDRNATQR